ncbi:MAG: hypothetical protein LC130_37275 [Bryobacterales bacterium]|nr:hypothetical protein [Bryobacterales bacterium]
MNDISKAISQLERRREKIDRAIAALRDVEREVEAPVPTVSTSKRQRGSKPAERTLTPEGRRRIAEATRKRWAAKRAADEALQKKAGTPAKRASTRKARKRPKTAKSVSPMTD